MAEIRSIQNLLIVYYYLYIPKCLKKWYLQKPPQISPIFVLEAKEL